MKPLNTIAVLFLKARAFFKASAVTGVISLLLPGPVAAQTIPVLPEISPAIAAAHPDLAQRRYALAMERDVLRNNTRQHNGRCRNVEEGSPEHARCDISLAKLEAHIRRHIKASERFIAAFTIQAVNALAQHQGWSADKRARLNKALNKLKFDGDPNATGVMIRQSWRDILARGQGEEFAREAANGEGPGFPGAGTQNRYEDCAIFALANSAGLPYGVVAARATELMREGEWRPAAERANPQQAIEQRGLNGGEVVMLAEAFGQAEVVASKDFAKTLKEGRPVMVNVVPQDGDTQKGHEVVLTKAFRRGSETWYEMMDSNQGTQRRLYLSTKELNTMLQENGVAFRPEPGTVPMLLR